MKGLYFSACLIAVSLASMAQDSSKLQLDFSGFLDVYYAAQEGPVNTDNIAFNHSRKNELNLNLAIVSLKASHDRYRANVGLMTGTYAQYNLAHEPNELRHIWEANAGLRLADNLWLDAGIFGSHLGFESAISMDNPTLTRSLVAENSPYYLSGVNLSYSPNEKWSFLVNLSNGWQIIQENNSTKAIGTQIQFKPTEKITLNSSTFIGEEPDLYGAQNLRWFHNFYGDFLIGDKIRLIVGFDYGQQQDEFDIPGGPSNPREWLGQAAILQYRFNERLATAVRQEYYADPDGVIIGGDVLQSYSLNFDLNVTDNAMFRIEGKYRFGTETLADGSLQNEAMFLVASIAAKL